MLSQLSYVPELNSQIAARVTAYVNPQFTICNRMGLVGVEPTTSPLSGVRSNQLSYKPAVETVAAKNRPAAEAPSIHGSL